MIHASPPQVHQAEYCTLCNQPAKAAWHGNHVIAVCRECAVEILPALIADAAAGSCFRPEHAERVIDRITYRFWRAMSLRLLRRDSL